MIIPQQLVDFARRAHEAGAPAHVIEAQIANHVQREAAREEAVEHAMALVEALHETPGAPKVRLWTGLATGASPRVYFPDGGYVTVAADGSIGGASVRAGSRGSLTFSESSLYPAQRQAYKKARDAYIGGLWERSQEQAAARAERNAELRAALGVGVAADEDSGRTLDFTGPNDGSFDVDDPDLRSNPDESHVRIVYGARRMARGGFAPVVMQHGPGDASQTHGGWVARPYDEDVAFELAHEQAEELASRYVGDWTVEVVPEGRANPRKREGAARRNPEYASGNEPVEQCNTQDLWARDSADGRGWELNDSGDTLPFSLLVEEYLAGTLSTESILEKVGNDSDDDYSDVDYHVHSFLYWLDNLNRLAEEPLELVRRASGVEEVMDGHHRLAAAVAGGLDTVPVVIVRHGGRANPRPHRRNPPLPPGFTTTFSAEDLGFDFFPEDDAPPPSLTETQQVFRSMKRGDVVTVGKTRWVIVRPLGSVQAWAYKHPSKHTKQYEIQLAGRDDEVVVFEVGGSAQRVSDDLVRGPLRATRETVEL